MSDLEYTPIQDIPTIIDDVRRFYKTGTTKDLAFRKHQLKQLIRYLEDNEKGIENAIWDDLKKHRMEILGEIAPVINECKYLIENLDRLAKPDTPKKRYWMNTLDTTYVRKEPKGVVLIIGAWNYPVHLALMPVVGAIAAGNCVILKPSEVCPHTSSFLTKTMTSYMDQRFFKIVNGAIDETTALLDRPFDHIFYTGGGTVGSIVMGKAAKFLTPVTLELGGKSPTYVASDAVNSITANRIVWGKLYNNGQTCVAPDYILVQRNHAEKLIGELQKSIKEFFGEHPEKCDSYGRIINHRQFDRLMKCLDSLDPATVVVGGQTNRDDLYMAPTVIYPASPSGTDLMDNEIFGPIIPVVPVDNVNDAVDIINSKPHPLVTYIFSNNKKETDTVIEQSTSGGVLVNDTLLHILEASLPFGGVGGSGMGNYHGDKSFTTFTHERSTMIKSTAFENVFAARYPPYNQDKYNIFSALVYGLPSSIVGKVQTISTFFGSTLRFLSGSSSIESQKDN